MKTRRVFFEPSFGGHIHSAPLVLEHELTLDVFLEKSSLNIYTNDRIVVRTGLIFPNNLIQTFEAFSLACEAVFNHLDAWILDSGGLD